MKIVIRIYDKDKIYMASQKDNDVPVFQCPDNIDTDKLFQALDLIKEAVGDDQSNPVYISAGVLFYTNCDCINKIG